MTPMSKELNEDGSAARPLLPRPAGNDDLLRHVREHVCRLRTILPVISVAVLALRRQDAELDEDIAGVLSRHAWEPLDFEIENLTSIVAALARSDRGREAPP